MRFFILFVVTPLFTFLCFTPAYAAGWRAVGPTTGEFPGFYTSVSANNTVNSVDIRFSIYNYVSNDCLPSVVIFEFNEEPMDNVGTFDLTLQYRIDKGQIYTFASTAKTENQTIEGTRSLMGVGTVYHEMDPSFIGEVLEGSLMIMRFDPDDDTTYRFSLKGSKQALSESYEACKALQENEWGPANSEWTL